ncbi:MAG: alpha/beta hydrolase [Pseudomonadota bacterium]
MKHNAQIRNTDLAYFDEGEGAPIVLIHGFASNASVNWLSPGWIKTLTDAGYRVIAIDNRGHGDSRKFYEEEAYTLQNMSGDVAGLIDHLGLVKPHVMGYSLGSRITATLAHLHGEKIGQIILAGNGYNMVEGGFDSSMIRDGLLAESLDATTTDIGRDFRFFAEQTKSDLNALAACIMGGRAHIPESVFQEIQNDTLVIIGTEDTVAIDGERLAALIPRGRYEPIPKRNHMNAVGDKVYKQKVLEFLQK